MWSAFPELQVKSVTFIYAYWLLDIFFLWNACSSLFLIFHIRFYILYLLIYKSLLYIVDTNLLSHIYTHTYTNICTITSIGKADLRKRAWKGLLQILTQAGDFWKRIIIGNWGSWNWFHLILPTHPLESLPVQTGISIHQFKERWFKIYWVCFYFSSFIEI